MWRYPIGQITVAPDWQSSGKRETLGLAILESERFANLIRKISQMMVHEYSNIHTEICIYIHMRVRMCVTTVNSFSEVCYNQGLPKKYARLYLGDNSSIQPAITAIIQTPSSTRALPVPTCAHLWQHGGNTDLEKQDAGW